MSRRIVFVNQAVNFLTVDILNSFAFEFRDISLITGNVHTQGTELSKKIKLIKIIKYNEKSNRSKIISSLIGALQIYLKLFFKYRKHEIFFISVPPMSYFVMLFMKNKFSLLLWDVYPDVLKVFGISDSNPVYKFWAWVNKKIFKRAYLLFTIGEKMAYLIGQYTDLKKIKIINLWTTFENFTAIPKSKNHFIKKYNPENKFLVQYSGNIGIGHNVEILVEVANLLNERPDILFMIIGKGSRIQKIKDKITGYNLKNFVLLPFQPDEIFPYSISAADLGLVILDDKISYGSIPNKTYNLMTAGKPILYISPKDSELVKYANKYNNGKQFESSEISSIAEFISNLATNPELQNLYHKNSLKASLDFTRKNTSKLTNEYIKSLDL